MKKDPKVFLIHILENIVQIQKYTKSISKSKFSQEFLIQDAVIRRLEIIGEAANNLPIHIRKKYKTIPWTNIIGMRNILIHEYFGISIQIVWETVQDFIPDLKTNIENILKDFN